MNNIYFKTLIVLIISFTYTSIRYNLFGNVNLSDIPTLIFNKTISLTMVFLMIINSWERIKGNKDVSQTYFPIITHLAIIHVLLSLLLISPEYFPKMYEGSRLNIWANLSMLSGVVLFTYLVSNIFKQKNWIIYLLVASHVLFLGYKGWLTPDKWHGFLPPLTIISFVVMLILIVINISRYINKKTKKG